MQERRKAKAGVGQWSHFKMTTGGSPEERNDLLQVTETEILLSFNIKRDTPLSKRNMLPLCVVGFFLLGGGVLLLIPNGGLLPTSGEGPLAILLLVLLILFLLPSVTALTMTLHGENARAPRFVQIDQEGVCFSHLFGVALVPMMVKWSEISLLVPYTRTSLGHRITALGIVPQDVDALLACIIERRSGNFFSRFLSQINISLYRRSHVLTPLNITQALLPISVDELIAMIQERFANELNKNRVTIGEWQN